MTLFTHHVTARIRFFYRDTQAVQKQPHLSALDTVYPSRHSIQTVDPMIEQPKKIRVM
jgi:hypothetical protein